jgi:hypothetical protein
MLLRQRTDPKNISLEKVYDRHTPAMVRLRNLLDATFDVPLDDDGTVSDRHDTPLRREQRFIRIL